LQQTRILRYRTMFLMCLRVYLCQRSACKSGSTPFFHFPVWLLSLPSCPIPPFSPGTPSHKSNYRVFGERCELSIVFGRSSTTKHFMVHFELKIISLVTQNQQSTTICVTAEILNWHWTQIILIIWLNLGVSYHYGTPHIAWWNPSGHQDTPGSSHMEVSGIRYVSTTTLSIAYTLHCHWHLFSAATFQLLPFEWWKVAPRRPDASTTTVCVWLRWDTFTTNYLHQVD